MAVTSAQVQELYVALLGRAADKAGLDYWVSQINAEGSTLTLENVRANFVNEQAEYAATYGNLSRADLVETIYTNLFERTPTAAEKAYWVQDGVSADQLVVAFLNGASTADQAVVTNKVFVANAYTTTVGASFNAAAAAKIIADVDGTVGSLNNAISSLQNGSLPGQVPGLALIQGLQAAQQAVTSFEINSTAAVNKFLADFKANTTANEASDVGTLTAASAFADKLTAVKADADDARSDLGSESLAVVTGKAADTQKALDDATAKLTVAEKQLVNTYNAAVLADKAATGATADQIAAASAGLDQAEGYTAALAAANTATGLTLTDGDSVWAAYVGTQAVSGGAAAVPATDAVRAQIAEAFKNVSFFTSTFKPAGDAEHADLKAEVALTAATTALNTSADGNGDDYLTASQLDAAADKKVADVAAADAVKAQIDAINANYVELKNNVTEYTAATTGKIAVFNTPADVELRDITGATMTGSNTVKETFYFQDKIAATDDVVIGTFTKGDSIYLGSGLTNNAGALSSGNNSVLEFFLIQDGADAKLVVETAVFGSANTDLTGAVVSEVSSDASVITLTGVNVADLQVVNGLVSFA